MDDVGALGSEATSSRSSPPTEYIVSALWQSATTGPLWSLELDRRAWGLVSKRATLPSCPAAARTVLLAREKESPSLGVVSERAMLTAATAVFLTLCKKTSPAALEGGKAGHGAAQHGGSRFRERTKGKGRGEGRRRTWRRPVGGRTTGSTEQRRRHPRASEAR